jgi:predicted metal-dependent peptidase
VAAPQTAADAIVAARVHLLMKYPFFGTIALRFELVDATDSLATAATDGLRLYYNSDFILGMKPAERVFVLAHEVLHVVFWHLRRKGKRNHDLFNMACDYVVNALLIDETCGRMPVRITVRKGKKTEERVGLYDKKYRGWSSEDVYEDLLKRNVKPVKGLDDHLEAVEDKDGKEVIRLPGGGVAASSEAEIRDEVRQIVLDAAAVAAGKMPQGLERQIRDLIDPQLDWRDLLNAHLQSSRRAEYDFTVADRKVVPYGIHLPSLHQDERLDMAAALDCSGSVNEEMLRTFLSELRGILDTFSDYVVRLFCFDTQVYGYLEITPENADDLLDYTPKGRGGTAFECVWEYLEDNDIQPDRLVLYTDGYPAKSWGDPDYCDTLFVIYGPKSIIPPFGQAAYFKG